MRKQIRLSGSGGQGVITAAIIYAEAAVAEGKEAVQSQSYGPEARGGASKSEVIIDDGPIYHPHVKTPDVVLAMTQKAADKYYGDLGLPTCFSESEIGVQDESVLEYLADMCTGGGKNKVANFRPLDRENCLAIYRAANH